MEEHCPHLPVEGPEAQREEVIYPGWQSCQELGRDWGEEGARRMRTRLSWATHSGHATLLGAPVLSSLGGILKLLT